jgi:hypothetical protein
MPPATTVLLRRSRVLGRGAALAAVLIAGPTAAA